jgi:hypothetical protein
MKDVAIDGAADALARDDREAVESGLDLERLLTRVSPKMRQAIQHVKLDGLSVRDDGARDGDGCEPKCQVFAAVPFAILIAAARQGAPTNLTRTGALAGLVAGALGAVAYAFHCPDDFLPFIALWHGGGIAFCAAVGAVLGPRLLRW